MITKGPTTVVGGNLMPLWWISWAWIISSRYSRTIVFIGVFHGTQWIPRKTKTHSEGFPRYFMELSLRYSRGHFSPSTLNQVDLFWPWPSTCHEQCWNGKRSSWLRIFNETRSNNLTGREYTKTCVGLGQKWRAYLVLTMFWPCFSCHL